MPLPQEVQAVLINPPPYSALVPRPEVPLCVACLRQAGHQVQSVDLAPLFYDWVLSPAGLEVQVAKLRAQFDVEKEVPPDVARALVVYPHAKAEVEQAKQVLRSVEGYRDAARYQKAHQVIRHALLVTSAAHPGSRLTLSESILSYSHESSTDVLAGARDAVRNPYFDFLQKQVEELPNAVGRLYGIAVTIDKQLIPAMTLAFLLKKRDPTCGIVLFGEAITRVSTAGDGVQPLFAAIDAILLFEAEESWPQLVTAWSNGENWRELAGLLLPMEGTQESRVALRRSLPRLVPLNDLPTPDFSDFALDLYLTPGPVMPMYGSRGCAFACTFCAIPYAARKYRVRDTKRVMADMRQLREQHGTSVFLFQDPLLSGRTLRELADGIAGEGLLWGGMTRFHDLQKPGFAAKLAEAGCRRLLLGLESGNQRVLDLMDKRLRVDDVLPAVRACLAAGISLHLYMMVGFPGETPAEAEDSLRLAEAIRRVAVEEYHHPYLTAGLGRFALEKFSPIHQHPERFGVQVGEAPAGHDLALTFPFQVQTGMDRRAAKRVWHRVNSEQTRQESLPDGTFSFHAVHVDDLLEEMLVRAAYETGVPAEPERAVRLLEREARSTQYAPGVYGVALAGDPLWGEQVAGVSRYLYHPAADLVIRLEETGDGGRAEGANGVPPLETLAQADVVRLMRWGFVESDREAKTWDIEQDGWLTDSRLHLQLDPDVREWRDEESSVHTLFQPVNGLRIRVSTEGRLLLALCDGTRSVPEVLSEAAMHLQKRPDDPLLSRVLRVAVASGVLVVERRQ